MAKKKLLTIREFANEINVSKRTVQNAIERGHLKVSAKKNADSIWVIDPKKAKEEWVPRNSNIGSKREQFESIAEKALEPSGPLDDQIFPPLVESRQKKEFYEAELARIKVEKEMDKLVLAKDIEEQWIRQASMMRTKVLGLPSRFRQRCSEINQEQYEVLTEIVHIILEELVNEGTGED